MQRSHIILVLILLTLTGVALAAFLAPRDAHVEPGGQDVQALEIPRVHFARADLGAYHSTGPQEQPAWELSTDPELLKQYGQGASGVLLVRCNCGLVIRMLGHEVEADGTVHPSIWHDVPECGWHIFGVFDDWEHGHFKVEAPEVTR